MSAYFDESGPQEAVCTECGTPADAMVEPYELARLRRVDRAAREFIASEDRGPFESAVAVRDLRNALGGAA
jgi:hypothetical protein